MRDDVKKAVVAVLRRSQGGFSTVWSRRDVLTAWQRHVNWVAEQLDADNLPFRTRNFDTLPLSCVAKPELIDEAIQELEQE